MPFSMSSQNIKRLRLEAQHGFIIEHSNELKPFAKNKPYSFVFSMQWMGTERGYWEACNCFHYLGLQFSYLDFGDSKVMGKAYSLAGTFEPQLWTRDRFSVSLNSGIGISWLTRIHHAEKNPLNKFFSSHLSFLLFLTLGFEYRITDAWGLYASVNYNHISNGGQKQPNLGVNFPQAGLGLNYYLSTSELPKYSVQAQTERWQFWVESGFITNKTGEGNKRRPAISFVGGSQRILGSINAVGAGMEFSKDYAYKKVHDENNNFTLAPFIAHHFHLGRFDFSQRIAWYIKQSEKYAQYKMYQRYALLFRVKSGFHLGTSLKAHGHVAANLDFRTAWKF